MITKQEGTAAPSTLPKSHHLADQLDHLLLIDTANLGTLDDPSLLEALSARHRLTLPQLLDHLLRIHEFDTQKVMALTRARKRMLLRARNEEGGVRGKEVGGGYLNYMKKMKYFPKIAGEEITEMYDGNVQPPLT